MTFSFQGLRFRIGFHHDKSRDWAAHRFHAVTLIRDGDGPVFLHCLKCGMQLSHLSKAARLRSTKCVILREDSDGWRPIASACGRLNVKAGDKFSREPGRVAALEAALNSLPEYYGKNREFRSAVWSAYWSRCKKSEAVKHVG
jgi:hypothetical protein